MKGDYDISAIEARLAAATPGPWQRSYFVNHRRYREWSDHQKREAMESERLTIRGPGVIGAPECNIVLRFSRVSDSDAELVAHTPDDLRALLSELKRTREQRDALAKALERKRFWESTPYEDSLAERELMEESIAGRKYRTHRGLPEIGGIDGKAY